MTSLKDLAIQSEGVQVAFGGVFALSGVDISVPSGQVFVLCGPNGSGKTTWLNCVSGFVKPLEGDLRLKGSSVLARSPDQRARLGLGRTFQNPHVLPHALVHNVLSFGLHQQDVRSWLKGVMRPFRFQRDDARARSRFTATLEEVGLPASILDARLTSLSLGQLKMIDIARALLAEPTVLLMDEPTSGLSPDEIERLRGVVDRLRQRGGTVLLVEHNVQFVLDLADRVAVLHRGEVLAAGAPRETLRRREVVEAYLGPAGRRQEPHSGR